MPEHPSKMMGAMVVVRAGLMQHTVIDFFGESR